MLTRILVAVVALPALLAVIFLAPLWAMGIVMAAISAGAAWELMKCTQPGVKQGVRLVPVLTAALIPLLASFGLELEHYMGISFALFFVMFCVLMLTFRGGGTPMSYTVVAMAMLAGAIIPLFYASLVRLGADGRGGPFVLLPFVAAFSSDSGAYFVGVALGKHKLVPHLSPKKTVEGAVGGLACALLIMLGYGWVLTRFGYTVNYLLLAVYGVVGSVVCQLGDLSFSAIKRETGIKDYSHLIPGHGGMLDRFDSTVFTAPTMELLVLFWPAIFI